MPTVVPSVAQVALCAADPSGQRAKYPPREMGLSPTRPRIVPEAFHKPHVAFLMSCVSSFTWSKI
ncbi:MAG: hypothetical protein QOI95_3366 [Acidimicrobiaceae bacterium]|jgi:hypothetical protein